MKHIKTFENNTNKYKKGDYVIMKYKTYNKKNSIFKVDFISDYTILLKDLLNPENSGWYIYDDILRKASQDEIDIFNIELNMKKYNL